MSGYESAKVESGVAALIDQLQATRRQQPADERNDVATLVAELEAVKRLPPPARRRVIRERAGASRRKLAAALHIHVSTLIKWESGTAVPTAEHATRYREALEALEKVS